MGSVDSEVHMSASTYWHRRAWRHRLNAMRLGTIDGETWGPSKSYIHRHDMKATLLLLTMLLLDLSLLKSRSFATARRQCVRIVQKPSGSNLPEVCVISRLMYGVMIANITSLLVQA